MHAVYPKAGSMHWREYFNKERCKKHLKDAVKKSARREVVDPTVVPKAGDHVPTRLRWHKSVVTARHVVPWRPESTVRLLVWLMSPSNHQFEIIHCEVPLDEAQLTVVDVLAQLPNLATHKNLKSQSYNRLIRWSRKAELAHQCLMDKYCWQDGEIVIALPLSDTKYSAENVSEITLPLLQNTSIQQILRRARISGREVKRLKDKNEIRRQAIANHERSISLTGSCDSSDENFVPFQLPFGNFCDYNHNTRKNEGPIDLDEMTLALENKAAHEAARITYKPDKGHIDLDEVTIALDSKPSNGSNANSSVAKAQDNLQEEKNEDETCEQTIAIAVKYTATKTPNDCVSSQSVLKQRDVHPQEYNTMGIIAHGKTSVNDSEEVEDSLLIDSVADTSLFEPITGATEPQNFTDGSKDYFLV